MTYEQVVAQLTAPGAPFEVVTEDVRGRPMKNFKNREKSLREKIANAGLRGDATCMVQGERRISYGEGVERVFPVNSPRVEKIEVERRGRVRRAKLTYLRGRIGKGATAVKEKETARPVKGAKKAAAAK